MQRHAVMVMVIVAGTTTAHWDEAAAGAIVLVRAQYYVVKRPLEAAKTNAERGEEAA